MLAVAVKTNFVDYYITSLEHSTNYYLWFGYYLQYASDN